MIRIRTFDEKTEKEICNLYQEEGQTLVSISRIYHCRTEAIKAVLTKYNIQIKYIFYILSI